jgi:oxygen-independent coproporphyrinogen-3 oxidase
LKSNQSKIRKEERADQSIRKKSGELNLRPEQDESDLRSRIACIGSANNDALGSIRHLYVHIPFCPKICPYCSFYKEASDRNKTQGFLEALLAELDHRLCPELKCETIFFGGGTPSALTVRQLEFLLRGLRERLDLSSLAEWTLEMNPATVSLEKARLLHEFGINRISMGVQSFESDLLEKLGRVHSVEQALRSYEILRQAGFQNINLDFIFGIPGQTLEAWQRTIRRAISLGPEHLSAYCLTYEEDTEFFLRWQQGEFTPNEEADADLFLLTMDLLAQAGYEQYEISNHARPGYECRHNLAYWQAEDYLGLGPSAFSTVRDRRWQNVRDTAEYMRRIGTTDEAIVETEELTSGVRQTEKLAFELRTNRGVGAAEVKKFRSEFQVLEAEGLVQFRDDRFVLTRRGRMVADSIAELFV